MKNLNLLCSALLLFAIGTGTAQAQKISDLESEPAAVVQPEVTQIGDWGVICDPNGDGSCAMTQLGKDPQGSPAIEFVVRKVDEEKAEI